MRVFLIGVLVLSASLPLSAQQLDLSLPYRPPTAEEWQAAGLDPADLGLAQRYQVTIDDWKDMQKSRYARQTAGWVCVGVALLTPLIQVTLHYGADIPFNDHPELEAFIMADSGAFLALVSGIILLASAPDADDFRYRFEKRSAQQGVSVLPSPGGLALAGRF